MSFLRAKRFSASPKKTEFFHAKISHKNIAKKLVKLQEHLTTPPLTKTIWRIFCIEIFQIEFLFPEFQKCLQNRGE